MTIYFYSKIGEYGEFSNFSSYGIEVDGDWWPTVEHYFQAQKFHDVDYQERIRGAGTAKLASDLGRNRKILIRSDWELEKNNIMHNAVLIKFITHKKLQALLLSTGDQNIIENAPGDYYWGCGKDGSGCNHLGKILMNIREQLLTIN